MNTEVFKKNNKERKHDIPQSVSEQFYENVYYTCAILNLLEE